MRAYLLRDIDADLWDQVRRRARSDGLSVRAVILHLLRAYVAGRVSVGMTSLK
jgi:hypothetical protein